MLLATSPLISILCDSMNETVNRVDWRAADCICTNDDLFIFAELAGSEESMECSILSIVKTDDSYPTLK